MPTPFVLLLGFAVALTPIATFAESPVQTNGSETATNKPNFQREILPLLSNRCFHCHGPDPETRESGLRLDDRGNATSELESGETAIVPGKLDASAVWERINSDDEFLRMPPAETGPGLSASERDLLKRWIESGAEYRKHWAYELPTAPPRPEVAKELPRSANRIDDFVLAGLRADGLVPNSIADRHTLLRRVTLDLTGLPPTPGEIDRFFADTTPGAYERLVDRLLASPDFGERWARPWLDLARYADSAGYAQDPARVIWKYRDWVITALNQNMPYDRFTTLQLAGDLLPNPSEEDRIATAFHRNTMTNSEGGTDDEEFRVAAVVDRTNTTAQVWMGLTLGCAQCHTHKYDPITQEDYFRFYAILNNTADADRGNEAPTLLTFSDEEKARRAELTAKIAELQAELKAKAKQKIERTLPADTPIRPRFVRIELPGESKILSLAEVQVFTGETNVASGKPTKQSSTDYNGPSGLAVDGNTDGRYEESKSVTHTAQSADPWWEVDLGAASAVDRIVIWNRTDNNLQSRLAGYRLVLLDADRNPLLVDSPSGVPNPSSTISVPPRFGDLTKSQKSAVASRGGEKNPGLAGRIKALEKQRDAIRGTRTPILEELTANKRRKTFIQIRGNFLETGKQVTPGVLSSFHPAPTEEPNRLDLARWILDDANPLTARVAVNRVWGLLFGIGLVETSEDFGLQGELPSHPELLDHLAVEFTRHGWDRKWLIRQIVTSRTYRQSSEMSDGLKLNDPRNRRLAAGPRFRLPAEMIRDQALAASGLLSRKMLGPSVRPYRPNLGIKAAFGGSTDWQTSAGEDRHRRGLYTSWRRTSPYPSMTTFDAPSREVCTIRRIRTNTPLQALVTMNDPVFVEAAQALARRVIESSDDRTERIDYAFRLVVGRPPRVDETAVVSDLLDRMLSVYRDNENAARTLATDPLGLLPATISPADAAAWTVIGNVLFNLDETLARR